MMFHLLPNIFHRLRNFAGKFVIISSSESAILVIFFILIIAMGAHRHKQSTEHVLEEIIYDLDMDK